MEKLKEEIEINGTGVAKLTARRVSMVGNNYIYLRSDGYYEVFIAKVAKSGDVFGKHYPEREVYPSNEDFGVTAWTYSSKESAYNKFVEII